MQEITSRNFIPPFVPPTKASQQRLRGRFGVGTFIIDVSGGTAAVARGGRWAEGFGDADGCIFLGGGNGKPFFGAL